MMFSLHFFFKYGAKDTSIGFGAFVRMNFEVEMDPFFLIFVFVLLRVQR